MNLKNRLFALLAIVLVGFVLFASVMLYTLNELKVGGTLYSKIVQGKDLVADILPPPEYIIESYLVSLQLDDAVRTHAEPGVISSLTQQLTALEKDYDTRHVFWQAESLDDDLKEAFLDDSFKHAKTFYQIVDSRFIPAVASGESDKMELALKDMQNAYNLHRKAIDKVVDMSNKRNENTEKLAAAVSERDQFVSFSVMLITFLGALAYTAYFARKLLHDLGGEPVYACEVAKRIAAGDLSIEIQTLPKDESSLLAYMKHMRDQLHVLVRSIQSEASQVGATVMQLSQASGTVALGSRSQSESASSMAAAVEELTVSIRQVADKTGCAGSSARQVGNLSGEGEMVMQRAVGEMSKIVEFVNSSSQLIDSLGKDSAHISSIAQVIKEIADQTNLLALNAAIEAARAGEQGRGFAVVADEVRKLAERTTRSTQEISQMLEGIQNGTATVATCMRDGSSLIIESVSLIRQAENSMAHIKGSAEDVISEMNDIASSLKEQSTASNDVAHNVECVAAMSEKNGSSISGVAETAHSLEGLAASLQASVSRFQI